MAWNQDWGEGANPGSSYEQQSWRDSFNGGRAAGDWTGNHNARLDAEREAFQGATWSGSSSQPSALQLAQSLVGTGPALGSVAVGTGSSGTGPASEVVSTAPVVTVPTQGPGRQVVVMGGPLSTKIKDTATGGYAGIQVLPNPNFSDVENWWEPRYGEPGEWLGGIVNIGADAYSNVKRWADEWRGPTSVVGPRSLDPIWGNPGGQRALEFLSGVGAGFVLNGPTLDADLPDPMVYRPASAW